jgi:two-component system response regulator RstA
MDLACVNSCAAVLICLNNRKKDDLGMPTRIIFVEDDNELANLISEYLMSFDYDVTLLNSGEKAVEIIMALEPDLVLLDIMLPGKDGLTICRELRQQSCKTPIIMLTSINSDTNQILGFEMGATDYVLKTTPPSVLVARIKAHLRRQKDQFAINEKQPSEFKLLSLDFGILQIDPVNRSVHYLNEVVNFSTGEFDLLWELASHAGEVSSRERLLKVLRGVNYDGFDRSIDAAVSRLRKKLGDDPNNPQKIKTVRHKGYLFVNDAWQYHA